MPRHALLALAAVAVILTGCDRSSASPDEAAPAATVAIAGSDGPVELDRLELADTPEERARGLMGRTELGADDGMLFAFPEPATGPFWMKDTLIPLSIAFWGEDGRIDTILEMTPCEADPCETYPADAPYMFALEMPQGWFDGHGVEVGDRADVELPTG